MASERLETGRETLVSTRAVVNFIAAIGAAGRLHLRVRAVPAMERDWISAQRGLQAPLPIGFDSQPLALNEPRGKNERNTRSIGDD